MDQGVYMDRRRAAKHVRACAAAAPSSLEEEVSGWRVVCALVGHPFSQPSSSPPHHVCSMVRPERALPLSFALWPIKRLVSPVVVLSRCIVRGALRLVAPRAAQLFRADGRGARVYAGHRADRIEDVRAQPHLHPDLHRVDLLHRDPVGRGRPAAARRQGRSQVVLALGV